LRFNGGKVPLRFVVVVVLSFALLSFGLAFANAGFSLLAVKTNGTPNAIEAAPVPPDPTATSTQLSSVTVTDVEKLPLYPNAEQVKEEPFDPRTPYSRIIYFQAPATTQDVIAFYERELLNKGWLPNNANIYGLSLDEYRGFYWVDRVLPFRVTLSINITKVNDNRTFVSLWSGRTPDAGAVPTYPGAEQIQVSDTPLPIGDGSIQRLTTYRSSANVTDIKQFYQTIMVESGWRLSEESSMEMPGTLYTYHAGNTDHPFDANVSILVRAEDSGMTKVEIRARGNDVLALSPTPSK
jgi:hypothetical protein